MKKILLLFLVLLLLGTTSPVHAVTPEQRRVFDSGAYYFNIDEYCGPVTGSTSSNAASASASGYPVRTPHIKDSAAVAKAINDFIQEKKPRSPFAGMGQYFVQGGMRAGINPLMVVTQSLKETGLATISGSGMSSGSYNSFGRTATRSQPHVSTNRLWYKWDSWQASLYASNYPATGNTGDPDDIFQYIARRYADKLDNFETFLHAYAPAYENDTATYIRQVVQWSQEIANKAGPDAIDLGTIGTQSVDQSTLRVGGGTGCRNGEAAGIENFVFYSQYDSRWKDHPFGNSLIGPSGCGPTSLAMVVATLANRNITPIDTANFGTQQGHAQPQGGSSWSLFERGPSNWGLSSSTIGQDFDAAAAAIRSGALVIASGTGAMPYTNQGHIIVIRGVKQDGSFVVADPQRTTGEEETYTQAQLIGSTRNMWVITK